MTYIDGFVAAVSKDGQAQYRAYAAVAAKLFLSWGAIRVVENWGDDVPTGKMTDFSRAVAAGPDEVVVFSWIEYPDKAVRDSVQAKMMSDPGMAQMTMPFDAKRMIYGGFTTIVSAT